MTLSAIESPPYLRARLTLFWERALPALSPVFATLGVFFIIAGLAPLELLPLWLRWILVVVFVGAIGAAVRYAWRRLQWPDLDSARRRIEQINQLAHRPLEALIDQPVGGDQLSQALWRAHVVRMATATKGLRVGPPRSSLSATDPFALRALLVAGLVVTAAATGSDWPTRLGEALWPSRVSSAPPTKLDVWITPPAYTGQAPIFASALPAGQSIAIAQGSEVLAQTSGLDRPPALVIDGRETMFAALGGDTARATAKLSEGARLAITSGGRELAAWPISIVPDKPPTIQFTAPPAATVRAALRLDYDAMDDYGVETVTATLRRPGSPEDARRLTLDLAKSVHRKEAKGSAIQDLTADAWAGEPVEIQLSAIDGIGQFGRSDWVAMILPEREFRDPTARAIIEQRKILMATPDRAPSVAEALIRIASNPDAFAGDVVVFLALVTAEARLTLKDKAEATTPVADLLWDTAIRIENGDAGLRERDLRAAEQSLRDALAAESTDADLARALNDFQQAMDRYLDALQRQAFQPKPGQQPRPLPRDAQKIDRSQIQKMLDQARELARTGQKEAAQAMLDQLRQLMENLTAATEAPDSSDDAMADDSPDASERAMSQLQDLAGRQRDLMDRSFRRAQRGKQGQPGDQSQDGDTEESMAAEQGRLREELGEMMRELGENGEIPGGFGKAERAMRGAEQSLKGGAPGRAAGQQGDALSQMRDAARSLAEQAAKAEQDGRGDGQGRRAGRRPDKGRADGRDPLGREGTNIDRQNTDMVKPSDQFQRGRDIYDELRRRAADPGRPKLEQEYIDRLLKRF